MRISSVRQIGAIADLLDIINSLGDNESEYNWPTPTT